MRQASRGVPAAWLLAAACALTAAVGVGASTFTELTYTVAAAPQTCGYLAHNFGSRYFDYNAGWSSSSYVPDGCTLEISSLYMDGTCSSLRNNNGQGCGGAIGATVGGSNASCLAAVQDGSGSWWQAVYPNSRPTLFDTGSLCADTSTGYFYIHNTCNASFTFGVTLQVWTYSSCSGSGFPSWARVTIGVICGIVAMVILATAFRRCRRAPRPPPPAVQMAAPPQAPPGGYYAGAPAGYPPPGPAGYPPSQPPGYAGAWGAAPSAGSYGATAGYGTGGYGAAGYGQQGAAAPPPHYPPPMTTVVLGGPEEGVEAAQGAGAQLRPQQAPAGGDSASKV